MPTIDIVHDLRNSFGPARDQLTRPTCLAFAVSDAHAAVRGDLTPLSCDYLFFHAQRLTGRSFLRAATTIGITTSLQSEGQPPETSWPYKAILPADLSTWAAPTGETVFRRNSHQTAANLIKKSRESIASGMPPVIVMRLTAAFDLPIDAVVKQAAGDPVQLGRIHAVVGIASGSVDGNAAVLVRNSWGADWGDAGCAWLEENYLAPLMIENILLQGEP